MSLGISREALGGAIFITKPLIWLRVASESDVSSDRRAVVYVLAALSCEIHHLPIVRAFRFGSYAELW